MVPVHSRWAEAATAEVGDEALLRGTAQGSGDFTPKERVVCLSVRFQGLSHRLGE